MSAQNSPNDPNFVPGSFVDSGPVASQDALVPRGAAPYGADYPEEVRGDNLAAAADEIGRVASNLHAAVNNTSFDTAQQSAVSVHVNRLLALQTQLQTAADGNAPASDPFKDTRTHAGTEQYPYKPAPWTGRQGEQRSGTDRRNGNTADPRGRGAPERRSGKERRVS